MKQKLLTLAFLLTCLSSRMHAEELFRIRVLTYNIHHGEGVDRKLDLPRIAQVIRSVSPDVVALQEVDRRAERSDCKDQPAELGALLKMNSIFEKNINLQGGQYGNAVLSKWPVVKHKNVHLPSFDNGEQRGVLICELKPPSMNEPMLLFCTHLDHRRSDRERFASAERINELIAARGSVPAILAGDLNARRDSRVLGAFTKRWQLVNEYELPTTPVAEPKRQIDFILYRPIRRWKTIDVRVLDEAIASDHRALFAVLEMVPQH